MVRAEIRLYRGKRPTMDQMERFDEKINKIVKEKFMNNYKLKSRDEENELKKRMDELQMTDVYKKKKKLIIEEELERAKNGGNLPISQTQPPPAIV